MIPLLGVCPFSVNSLAIPTVFSYVSKRNMNRIIYVVNCVCLIKNNKAVYYIGMAYGQSILIRRWPFPHILFPYSNRLSKIFFQPDIVADIMSFILIFRRCPFIETIRYEILENGIKSIIPNLVIH